ncbi:MAG: helix-turn-helix domain-containing protein [Candidatus Brocadiaceae bacterium]|nr:helix-turn-helix domain-containing protein [Candidatus Brocadiaceae bacterium]
MQSIKTKPIRLRLHLTQEEFALLVGVNIRTVQKWEDNTIKTLREKTARKIRSL